MPKKSAPMPVVAQRDFPFKRNNTYFIKFPDESDPTGFKELELPGVTTVLSETSDKQALVRWGMKVGATAAIEHPGISIEEAVALAQQRKTDAMDLGKEIHRFAEDYTNGKDISLDDLPDDLKPYGKAFLDFIALHKPRVLFTEVCVFNKTHGYAGTADLIAILSNGKTAILDWKTGKYTYVDNHLQQMAYANAEYIYTVNKKTGKHEVIKMPEIHEQYLVHLKSNGTAHLIPVNEPFEDFLAALRFWPYAKKRRSFY